MAHSKRHDSAVYQHMQCIPTEAFPISRISLDIGRSLGHLHLTSLRRWHVTILPPLPFSFCHTRLSQAKCACNGTFHAILPTTACPKANVGTGLVGLGVNRRPVSQHVFCLRFAASLLRGMGAICVKDGLLTSSAPPHEPTCPLVPACASRV
ncbi:hypothetical protein VTK73DRAFT_930 [Phialemonium thermophilum]|uniref:Uncharacterized protein n=1 Tax=Phialemonium thermophilum TaxID=223376 RepID=A0ABR3VU57_9PEZI